MKELNYEELVQGYYDNLNNNLRNFKGGPGFLETWVHDEDHNRSLLEILDLAHSHGVNYLKIHLPANVTSTLNLDWLRRNSSAYGFVDIKESSLIFNDVKGEIVTDDYAGVSEAYIKALKNVNVRHEGNIEQKDLQSFDVKEDDSLLAVAVDANGIVKEAKHKGFKGPARSMIDTFCEILIGRPLQEGAEHGAIRAEVLLRDPVLPIKVKGLLTPEVADPAFESPQKMVRTLWYDFVKTNNIIPKRNFWRDIVPSTWLEKPYEDKINAAQKIVKEGCQHFGLQEDVQVIKILNETRFVLSYTQDKAKPNFGNMMIKLEHWLRNEMNFEIELQLESIEDRNKRVERTKRT